MWSPRLIILQPTPYCNINCAYCYLANRNDRRLMSRSIVEAVRDKLFARFSVDSTPTVVWHAGEPTVAPISWYQSAYDVLRPAAPERTTFSMQSNGVAISDDWVEFLRDTETRIGLSIDGPRRFHDARRKTRRGEGTWSLAMRALHRLQAAGSDPAVITVLHPDCLRATEEFYRFYRENDVTQVSFSIDEAEGANKKSSFDGYDHKPGMTEFIARLLDLAFVDGYPLYIREVERIARVLVGDSCEQNEQIEAWQVVVVAANGDVTTFSPEFMEIKSAAHNDFCFGNILSDDFDGLIENKFVRLAQEEIDCGTAKCRAGCRYFPVCGGGAPVNKMFENGSLASSETSFCRLSIQAAADALTRFLSDRSSVNADQPKSTPEAWESWRAFRLHASAHGGIQ